MDALNLFTISIEGIPLITRFKTEQVNARNLVVLKY